MNVDICPSRVRRLVTVLHEKGCAYAIAAGKDHTIHLAGYGRYLGLPTAVIVAADGSRTLVVARSELAAAEKLATIDHLELYGGEDYLDPTPAATLAARCAELVPDSEVALAGGPDLWAAFATRSRQPTNIEPELMTIRLIKDEDEIALMTDACRLTLVAHAAVEAAAAERGTEIELYAAAFAAAQAAASEPIEFIGATSCGINTGRASHPPGMTRAVPGGPVLSDIAVRHRGYWGDSARTFAAETEPTADVRDALTDVLAETASRLLPGRPVADVYADMHRAVIQRLPDASFPHHGGHSLGVTTGERPKILPTTDALIEEGMVIALEPGAYWPGSHGARMENTYLVRRTGGEALALEL